MLPEPDLFANVRAKNESPVSSLNHNCDASNPRVTTDSTIVPGQPVNTSPTKGNGGLTQLFISDRSELPVHNINLMCHPYPLGTGRISSKDHQLQRQASVKSLDPHERRARRWYLTVIVLLYVGLITSFCLNVSLLLKSYPDQPIAAISLSPQGLGLDESQLWSRELTGLWFLTLTLANKSGSGNIVT